MQGEARQEGSCSLTSQRQKQSPVGLGLNHPACRKFAQREAASGSHSQRLAKGRLFQQR